MPRPVNLSLELLRTFATVVDTEGDAVAAARRLRLNQPSMSKRLRYLQHTSSKVLEKPWLRREGKTWRLTAQGEEVLPAVREIVSRYEHLASLVSNPKPPPDHVSFACGHLAAAGLVRDALRHFRPTHPGVRLRLSMARGRQRIRGVSLGSFDLALVTHDEGQIQRIARRKLHLETIETDRLALVCGKKTDWHKDFKELKDKVTPKQMQRFPLILPDPDAGLRKMLNRVFKEQGLLDKLDIVMEVGGWKVILENVLDGNGVGVVSEAALRETKDVEIRYLDPAFFRPSETKLICRYRLDRPEELDLSKPAADFRTSLLHVAAKRRETLRNGG